jgi:hypothetical protein
MEAKFDRMATVGTTLDSETTFRLQKKPPEARPGMAFKDLGSTAWITPSLSTPRSRSRKRTAISHSADDSDDEIDCLSASNASPGANPRKKPNTAIPNTCYKNQYAHMKINKINKTDGAATQQACAYFCVLFIQSYLPSSLESP